MLPFLARSGFNFVEMWTQRKCLLKGKKEASGRKIATFCVACALMLCHTEGTLCIHSFMSDKGLCERSIQQDKTSPESFDKISVFLFEQR